MAHFEALYGRKYISLICWDDFTKVVTLGPELFIKTPKLMEMIREIQGCIRSIKFL